MKAIMLLQIFGIGIGLVVLTGCAPKSDPIPSKDALQTAQTLTGHERSVTHLVFSRDGKMLASGSDDGSVILWDVADLAAPAKLGRVQTNDDRVRSFALSPDGKILVISTSSSTPPPMHIYIWDVSNPGAPVLLSEPPPVTGGFVIMYSLAFSPDGRVLAIGSEDRTITLWDMTDPAMPASQGLPVEGHESGVRQVAFSPDGEMLASGDADGIIILWSMSDPKAPRKLATISDHEDAVSALAFSPDGKMLAVGGKDDVQLWDVDSAETLAVLDDLPTGEEYGVGVSLDFSPDGSTLATSSGKTTILWDVSDRSAPSRLGELRLKEHLHSVAFSSDGKTLATGSGDGPIILSDVSKPNLTKLPSVSPKPTPLPAVEWPVLPLTKQQITSVNECDIESLASERYPDTMTIDDLQSAFAPQSGCDWAVLALAYANWLSDDESLPEAAKGAFSQAVSHNFGFALATSIFYRYFGSTPLVKAPAFAQQEITDIGIKYSWSGLGEPVSYALEIHQANTKPTLAVTPDETTASLHPDVDPQLLQALAPALTDLLPVESKFTLSPCTDNYPDWDVTLTFADSKTINLTTDSNFLSFGGPWFAEMDKQTYIQFSSAFAEALQELVSAVGLPTGETAAMSCFGDSVLDKAFPQAGN